MVVNLIYVLINTEISHYASDTMSALYLFLIYIFKPDSFANLVPLLPIVTLLGFELMILT
jgi:hypothetical protein